MIKKLPIFFLFFFGCFIVNAQKISGKVFSKNTNKPIEKVAIITNIKTGTTTNKYGDFTIDLNNIKTITFSFLGYETKTISTEKLRNLNYKIYLSEIFNELNEVQLTIGKISLDSLLIRTKDSMLKKYISGAIKHNFYTFKSQKMDFKKLELDLKSSSLLSRKKRKLAQMEFETFSNELQRQNPQFSKEFVGTIVSKKVFNKKINKSFTINKIDTITGYRNNDIGKDINIDNIQHKIQNVVLKHLKKDKTYKVKTGLFKIEDSLSFKKVLEKSDSLKKHNSFLIYNTTNFKTSIENSGGFFKNEDYLNFLNTKFYYQKIEASEIIEDTKMYVISFSPKKSKAKFSGKIYINPNDFTIKKVTYTYAKGKRGEHLNLKWLFGIKFSENENSGTLFYEKNKDGKVYTAYFKETIKNYAYINRPIKFIENSKKREKVKFNIKVEVEMGETSEIFIKNLVSVPDKIAKGYKKNDFKKSSTYISKEEYAASSWKNSNIIIEYLKKYDK